MRATTGDVRRLPALVDGYGVRDEDCRRYAGCFDRWAASRLAAAKSVAAWAHCPTGCRHHDPRAPRQLEAPIGCTSGSVQRIGQ